MVSIACSSVMAGALVGLLGARVAHAEPPVDATEQLRALRRQVHSEVRIGPLRDWPRICFNNPYRLATQLGEDARSVSLTATYADLGLGLAFGPPDGLQHGAAVHASFALAGVSRRRCSRRRI